MNILGVVFLVVVAGGLAVFAYFVISFNVKRRHIAACASEASDDALEEIYRLVEGLGDEASTAFVLGKTNRTASEQSSRISDSRRS